MKRAFRHPRRHGRRCQPALLRIYWNWRGVLAIASLPLLAHGGEPSKKLIEFGWDEPGPAFLRTHISEMQQTPFDGCVFHVDYKKADGAAGSFTWQSWATQTFTEADLKDAFADLKSVRFGQFKYNFLPFNTPPAKMDLVHRPRAISNA